MSSNQSGDNNQRGGTGNFDPERAREASRRGGQQQGGSGNFADDPERASEAGRKGGQASHSGSSK